MIPKFRFWYEREDYYPDENYMRHVWGIEYITDSKIELNYDYIFNPYTNVAENIYAKTKIYLMQSTCIKDVNGVEIYEGDIVKSQNGTGGLIYKHIVEWNDFYKGFDPMRKDESYFNRDSCEVIGNIYENPELLEVTNENQTNRNY